MKSMQTVIIAAISVLAFAGTLFADITVESVQGKVGYKTSGGWQSLKAGMKLSEGTKISTGAKSMAVINIDDHQLKVRQLTMMKIVRNKRSDKGSSTRIGLKYGSLNAKVKKLKNLKTSFKISTTVATSSVRGTEQNVFFGAKSGMIIQVLEGIIDAESGNSATRRLMGRLVYKMKSGDAKALNVLSNVTNKSMVQVFSTGLTSDEKQVIQQFVGEMLNGSDKPSDYTDNNIGNKIKQNENNKKNTTVHIQTTWP